MRATKALSTSHPRIPLEELVSLPTFYFPQISWGRDNVAFYWDKSGRIEIWMIDLASGELRQVSHGEVPKSVRAGFVWSRDDRLIVFPKDRDGDEQHNLFRLDLETGQVEQLTDNPQAQEHPVEFSPDDQWLLVLSNMKGQQNLFKFHLERREYVQLTDYPSPVLGGGTLLAACRWSPDGQRIAYATNETATLKNSDIYICDADGGNKWRLLQVKEGSRERVGAWSPDGRSLAITSDASGWDRVGLCDVDSGEVRWLSQEGRDESAGDYSQDGRLLFALRNQDAVVQSVVYDLEKGEEAILQTPPGATQYAAFFDHDRRLLMDHTSITQRLELLSYDLTMGQSEVVLPAEYGSIDPARFVDGQYISYRSYDGLEIPAILYKPRDIPPDSRLPAIVEVHGGPASQFFRAFDPYIQFLVDRGFVLLQPNIRGSIGYGAEFRDMNLMDWGGGDLEDVAAGAGYLRQLPYVDPERIGVFGGSYGGYMTFMQLVKKPDLWKAGVAWIGITDLHRMYEKSIEHFKYFLRIYLGDPQENAELWRERSAINYAEDMRAKLLILHGVNDPRCPVDQARTFRDRLLELGRVEGEDFEYVELGKEGHGSKDIEQKRRIFKVIGDFMERWL